jgi:hypothetical protein
MATAVKAATKSEILTKIATTTALSRKQVSSVFDALSEEIKYAVGKKGPGIFAVPGLMKIIVIQKPAVKARKGIKVRPLKALKDFAK